MTLLTGWPLELTVDDILHGQGMDPRAVHKDKPLLLSSAERALNEGKSLLHPTALLREVGVREHRHNRVLLEDNSEMTGPLVARHLAGAQRVAAVVCTIGPELEDTVSRLLGEETLFALALDGMGNAAVEMLTQQICAHIGEQNESGGLMASTPLSPGTPEWPVEIGQREVFSLLDAARAGVSLTFTGMMIPKKSMSFIVGIGPDMAQTSLCEICSLKDTCRYQHEH